MHDVDAINAFDTLTKGLRSCGLKINLKPHKTVVLLGKCSDVEELQRRIQNFRDRGFHEDYNIKIHPSNGGSKDTNGYVHLGVPVGDATYCFAELRNLVAKFEVQNCFGGQVGFVQNRYVPRSNEP